MTTQGTLSRLESQGMVAILRGSFEPEAVLEIGRALVRGGVLSIEVTLNSHAALDAIALLSRHLGSEALIGAGTVLAPEEVDEAVASGARFLVSPGLDMSCVEQAKRLDVPFVPGVFTPTEVGQALRQGCKLLKLFPASEVRPDYLSALRGPFPQARFMVTGGIGISEIEPFHRAGAVAFGLGSSLVKEGREREEIEASARRAVAELKRIRSVLDGGR